MIVYSIRLDEILSCDCRFSTLDIILFCMSTMATLKFTDELWPAYSCTVSVNMFTPAVTPVIFGSEGIPEDMFCEKDSWLN